MAKYEILYSNIKAFPSTNLLNSELGILSVTLDTIFNS